MGSWWNCQVSNVYCIITYVVNQPLNNLTIFSTINHSSSAKEIAHAVNVIKPQHFLVDGVYHRKVSEALTLAQYSEATISTMVSRSEGRLLVSLTAISDSFYVLTGIVPG